MNTTKKKILALAISSVLLDLSIVLPADAALFYDIPESALSKNGKKVTICHFPPGNPENYQKITISTNALDTHIDHHDDVFAVDGECPPLPKVEVKTGCAVPEGIMDKVLRLLPEGKALAADSPLLTEDRQANILLKKDANVKVAFVDEGAGYTNTLSVFRFDKDNIASLTTDSLIESVIFENFSKKNSGGSLTLGDTVDLGTIEAGTGIGFTLTANGWDAGQNKLKTNRTANQIFRTLNRLNPETSDNSKRNYHTVLMSDPNAQVLVIGIEDLNRENRSYNDDNLVTDDDFNDAVLAICVDPWDAIESVESLIDIDTGVPGTDPNPPKAKVKGVSGRQSWSERTVPPTQNSNLVDDVQVDN
jgi:hypothetical protein